MVQKEIVKVIKYFDFFDYAPSLDEIFTFLSTKIDKQLLKKALKQKDLRFKIYDLRLIYCLKGRERLLKLKSQRKKITEAKIIKIRHFLSLLKLFPQIRLVGLSGSAAMGSCREKDDIDLFVITARRRLFTARFISIILAFLLGLKRSRGIKKAQNKVCLNLFFDERELSVPKFKRSEYVAHEVLQMKPLFARDDIYERFLDENKWVYKIFPNAVNINSNIQAPKNKQIQNFNLEDSKLFVICNLVIGILSKGAEFIYRRLQLQLINRHKTTEIITDTQLWFHPNDFEIKVRNLR